MSGNAADVAQFTWMSWLEARVDALWAWVVSISAFIWGVLVVAWEALLAWLYPFYVWAMGIINNYILPLLWTLQTWYLYVKEFIDTWVVPAVIWLQGAVAWIQALMLLVQGKLEDLINLVYNKVFKDIEELRSNIVRAFDTIKDVASVFSRDLADRIQVTEDKFLTLLNSYTRDLRDWAISSLHAATDPIIRKTNEISVLLTGFITQVADRFKPIENLIAMTFEKPQVFKRESVFNTSMRWGADLWSDLFAGVTPIKPITPGEEMVRLQVDPFIDKFIEDIFAEKVEGWQDVSQRVDEEIREKFYGELIPRKTEIGVPRLPSGAGGRF